MLKHDVLKYDVSEFREGKWREFVTFAYSRYSR